MKLSYNGATYTIPSTFSALTVGQFVELWKVRNQNFYVRFKAATGIDAEQFPLSIISELAQRLSWFDELELYLSTVSPAKLAHDIVEARPYSSIVKVQQMLAKVNGDVVAASVGIIHEYTGEDIAQLPVMEGLGMVRFFTSACHPSLIGGHSWPIYRRRLTRICLWPEWIGFLPSAILTRCWSWSR